MMGDSLKKMDTALGSLVESFFEIKEYGAGGEEVGGPSSLAEVMESSIEAVMDANGLDSAEFALLVFAMKSGLEALEPDVFEDINSDSLDFEG